MCIGYLSGLILFRKMNELMNDDFLTLRPYLGKTVTCG